MAIVEQDTEGQTYGQPTTFQESDLATSKPRGLECLQEIGLSPSAKPDLSSGSSS